MFIVVSGCRPTLRPGGLTFSIRIDTRLSSAKPWAWQVRDPTPSIGTLTYLSSSTGHYLSIEVRPPAHPSPALFLMRAALLDVR